MKQQEGESRNRASFTSTKHLSRPVLVLFALPLIQSALCAVDPDDPSQRNLKISLTLSNGYGSRLRTISTKVVVKG